VKQLAFDLTPPAAPTLDNFVTAGNAELIERLRGLALSPTGERTFYLWGAPASGRTHLLRAAVAEFERSGRRARYVADASMLSPVAVAGLDAVAVDDVERLDEAGQRALFNSYNRLRETGATFLAAGNAPPGGLGLRADLTTRLAWGLVYEVRALSDGESAHALAEHAAARGFELPPDVARYLLARVERDMRTLTAMVDSLDRYSLETKRRVNVPLVRELLERK